MNKTAVAPHLDGGKLKRRMMAAVPVPDKTMPPAFVEMMVQHAVMTECTIELEGRNGKLRIHWKGATAADLAGTALPPCLGPAARVRRRGNRRAHCSPRTGRGTQRSSRRSRTAAHSAGPSRRCCCRLASYSGVRLRRGRVSADRDAAAAGVSAPQPDCRHRFGGSTIDWASASERTSSFSTAVTKSTESEPSASCTSI